MIGGHDILDLVAAYWFAVYVVLVLAAVGNTLSSLDDLFVDLTYWVWRGWRRFFMRNHQPLALARLYDKEQQRIAVLIPAWDEAAVIRQMLELAVVTFDYRRYVIFVGTYPNDAQTQAEVDRVAAASTNVRKVVTHEPGPTSKADALNHCLAAAFADERETGEAFAAFVLHDAEDVVHPLELLLFNYLIPRKDLIQLPVFSLEREWWQMTGGHYQDEFAEVHSKDLVVREWLAGQVPSAGVGTGFSRRAMLALLEDSGGEVFDETSLTEDYEISFRLKAHGGEGERPMQEIFVRFPLELEVTRRNLFGTPKRVQRREWVGVREYFPDEFWAAVRQKARWLTGIIFQGSRRIGWQGNLALRYFLLRDRKAVAANLINMLGYFVLLNALAMWLYTWLVPDGFEFPPLVVPYGPLWWLLLANGLFLLNRVLHRVWFTWDIYGPYAAILSVPRQIWGNFVNFFACTRALRRVIGAARGRQKLVWEKTSHHFPGAHELEVRRRRLGELMLDRGLIDEAQLQDLLRRQEAERRPLGQLVLEQDITLAESLAALLAAQAGVQARDFDGRAIDPELLAAVPSELALHHGIVPVAREADGRLLVAAEGPVDVAVLDRIARGGPRPRLVIAPHGDVVQALRWFYDPEVARQDLEVSRLAVQLGWLSETQVEELWRAYRRRHTRLGEALRRRPDIDGASLDAALAEYARTGSGRIGEWLIDRGVVGEAAVEDALARQERRRSLAGTAVELDMLTPEQARALQRRAA